jgi:UDP-N-acetylglucosamine 2-epimerase
MTMTADLVIGMTSMILVEAVYLGRPVLSLQPGLRIPDTVPTNAAGLSRLVTHEAEIECAIEQALADRHTMGLTAGASDRLPASDASGRVVSLIASMLDLNLGERI